MEPTIRVYLDNVPKRNNQQEYHWISRAQCEGYESVSNGDNIRKVLEEYLADNPHFKGMVEVYRGDTLVFTPVPIKQWLSPEDRRPEHLKNFVKREITGANT